MKKLYLLLVLTVFVGSVALESKGNELTLNEKVTKALELAKYHLIDEEVVFVDAVYISPAQKLRNEADRIEQRKRDYDFIKSVLAEWKESKKR